MEPRLGRSLRGANRGHEQIAREILVEAAEIDRRDDELYRLRERFVSLAATGTLAVPGGGLHGFRLRATCTLIVMQIR
jgi:hypothetical protein